MLPEPSIYPRFVANQLLTEGSLNQMVEYFDNQVRDTRIYLNGLGIYYGLDLKVKEAAGEITLTIKSGIGVSSNGFLFKLEKDCTFKGYRGDVKISKETMWPTDCIQPEFENEYTVKELTDTTSNDATNPALTSADLTNKVVVLLCEFEEDNLTGNSRCFNDLDEKGVTKRNIVRALLFEKSDVEKFSKVADGQENGPLPKLFIERFGFNFSNPPSIRLNLITNTKIFRNEYKAIFLNLDSESRKITKRIGDAYIKAAKLFDDLFAVDGVIFNELGSDLDTLYEEIQTSNELLNVQYFYDYLKDLVLAYEEFACAELIQRTSVFPDKCAFPKFLLLGIPSSQTNPILNPNTRPTDCRNVLQRPPIEDIGAASVAEVRLLFERMKKLANEAIERLPYQSEKDKEIRITPSKGINVPLSERAIPFYLDNNVLRPCWNARLTRLQKTNEIPSYNPSNNAPPYNYPLLYDLDQYEFFRIEEHIGKNMNDVLTAIKAQRAKFNVPFDIQCVQLARGNDAPNPDKNEFDFSDLQLLYTKVRQDVQCWADEPNFTRGEELMSQLKEALNEFEPTIFEPFYDDIVINENNKSDCHLVTLKTLKAAFIERNDKFKQSIWFYDFAAKHPGLEHLGGVYKGGTFVLVFVQESANETPIVVADFCLPYSCCSDTPAIVYQLNTIEPKIIMQERFCGDDTTSYLVQVSPEGGVLSGDGIDPATNRFTPSEAAASVDYDDDEGNLPIPQAEVVISYEVEGISTTLCVILEKPPVIEIGAELVSTEYDESDSGNCRMISRTIRFFDNGGEANISEYEWQENGVTIEGLNSSEYEKTFQSFGEEINLTLIGRRGLCTSIAERPYSPCPAEAEVSLAFEDIDLSQPIDNTQVTAIKLILGIVGGTFSLSAMTIDDDGDEEILNIFPVTLTGKDSNPCKDMKEQFVFQIGDLPPTNLQGDNDEWYRLKYEFAECGLSAQVDFTIIVPPDNPPPPPPPPPPVEGGNIVQSPLTKSAAKSSSKDQDTPTTEKENTSSSQKTTKATTASKKKKTSPKPATSKLQNGSRILNLRRTAQGAIFKKMEEEHKIKGKTFGLVMSSFLVLTEDVSLLNSRFEEAMKGALTSVKRNKGEKKAHWQKIVETLLHNYLDKLVAASPTALDDATTALLKNQIEKMKPLDLDLEAIGKRWNGDELAQALKANSVKEILELLK